MSKNKKVLAETKIRWAQLGGMINNVEAKRRLNEANAAFPPDDGEMEDDEYGMEGDAELADLEGGDDMDMGDDLGGDDMDMGDDLGGDMGYDAGDEDMAARLITAITDVISAELGVDTGVEVEMDDMDMDDDLDGDLDMGDDLGDDDMGDDLGDDDLDMDDELMEKLENSINPTGGKVDHAKGDMKLKGTGKHLNNSINEAYADRLATNVVRKLAKHLKRK